MKKLITAIAFVFLAPSAFGALQLSIPIKAPDTVVNGMPVTGADSRVAALVHRISFIGIKFNPNGSVANANISIDSFVDNTAGLPIITDVVTVALTPAQATQVLAVAYARLKVDPKYAAAATIADPP